MLVSGDVRGQIQISDKGCQRRLGKNYTTEISASGQESGGRAIAE